MMKEPLFELGYVMKTLVVSRILSPEEIVGSLERHIVGDWDDDNDEERKNDNEKALESGGIILSSYLNTYGRPFWVMTDQQRRTTMIMLPIEYDT